MINQKGNKMTPAALNLYIDKKNLHAKYNSFSFPPPTEITAYACLVQ
jgi:hypothetical protein